MILNHLPICNDLHWMIIGLLQVKDIITSRKGKRSNMITLASSTEDVRTYNEEENENLNVEGVKEEVSSNSTGISSLSSFINESNSIPNRSKTDDINVKHEW